MRVMNRVTLMKYSLYQISTNLDREIGHHTVENTKALFTHTHKHTHRVIFVHMYDVWAHSCTSRNFILEERLRGITGNPKLRMPLPPPLKFEEIDSNKMHIKNAILRLPNFEEIDNGKIASLGLARP